MSLEGLTERKVVEIGETLERLTLNLKCTVDALINRDYYRHQFTDYLLQGGQGNPEKTPAKQWEKRSWRQ